MQRPPFNPRSSRTLRRHGTLPKLLLHMGPHVVDVTLYKSVVRDRICSCDPYLADEGVPVISESVVGDSSAPKECSTPLYSSRFAPV